LWRSHCSADRTQRRLREMELPFLPIHADVFSRRPLREYHWTNTAVAHMDLACCFGLGRHLFLAGFASDHRRSPAGLSIVPVLRCGTSGIVRRHQRQPHVQFSWRPYLPSLSHSFDDHGDAVLALGICQTARPIIDRRRFIFWLAGNRRRIPYSRRHLSCGDSGRRGAFYDRKTGAKIGSYVSLSLDVRSNTRAGLGRPHQA